MRVKRLCGVCINHVCNSHFDCIEIGFMHHQRPLRFFRSNIFTLSASNRIRNWWILVHVVCIDARLRRFTAHWRVKRQYSRGTKNHWPRTKIEISCGASNLTKAKLEMKLMVKRQSSADKPATHRAGTKNHSFSTWFICVSNYFEWIWIALKLWQAWWESQERRKGKKSMQARACKKLMKYGGDKNGGDALKIIRHESIFCLVLEMPIDARCILNVISWQVHHRQVWGENLISGNYAELCWFDFKVAISPRSHTKMVYKPAPCSHRIQ